MLVIQGDGSSEAFNGWGDTDRNLDQTINLTSQHGSHYLLGPSNGDTLPSTAQAGNHCSTPTTISI